MKLSDKFKRWEFPLFRMETFSDAVFAIVMTLLVLELKVPHFQNANNKHEVWEKLIEIIPIVYSWAISFFFLAVIWLHHHNIMYMATHGGYGSLWINIFLLFFICLLPFPSALMGQYPHQPWFVAFWGGTAYFVALMLNWLYYYNAKNFLKPHYDKKKTMKNVRLSFFGVPLLYLIAIAFAWVSVYISYVIFVFIPVFYVLPLDIPAKSSIEHN
jgi:uncharacterized membrane protein